MKQVKGKHLKKCLEEYEKRCPKGVECRIIKDMLKEVNGWYANGKMRGNSAQTTIQNIIISSV